MTVILVVCTANLCRSVMAQAMLSARLSARPPVRVASAGILPAGRPPVGEPPPAEVIAVMAAQGRDVAGHRSREVTPDDLAGADLVLGMAREHVRHCVVVRPDAWPRSFTLLELIRRGREAGPRDPGEPLAHWLARAGAGRDRRSLLGGSPADDVADPAGGTLPGYEATADLLGRLTHELAALGWPDQLR